MYTAPRKGAAGFIQICMVRAKQNLQELFEMMSGMAVGKDIELLFDKVTQESDIVESWRTPDGKLAYLSESCVRLHGYTRNEILADPEWMERIIHPEDLDSWKAWISQVTGNTNFKGKQEYRIITREGAVKWIETNWYPLNDSSGNFFGWRSTSMDITDRKQEEEQHEITEARYKAILDSQNELIVRHSPDNTITYVNKALTDFVGISARDLIGQKWFASVQPEDVQQIQPRLKELNPDRPSASIVLQNMRFDGQPRWIQWCSTGIFDKNGILIEYQVVGRDITDEYLTKTNLEKALQEVAELKEKLEAENLFLKDVITSKDSLHGIVANSLGMKQVLEQSRQVAVTDSAVLITGETGTGKELIARTIHQMSRRNKKMMVTVNCAALPASLIESELFGREKGAYTGALTRQIGRFELADQTTIFLDEIGELPLELQVKLMRILQFGEFERIGSPETHKTDIRVIAATNKDLKKALDDGIFRKDLYYRLNVFPIHIPPLRERSEDIPALTWAFISELTEKTGKRIDSIPRKTMDRLIHYSWPGNVRELRNVIEHAMILATGHVLDIPVWSSDIHAEEKVHSLEEVERRYIIQVLKKTSWRVRGAGGAAEMLGLNEGTLRFRMKKLGIQRPE